MGVADTKEPAELQRIPGGKCADFTPTEGCTRFPPHHPAVLEWVAAGYGCLGSPQPALGPAPYFTPQALGPHLTLTMPHFSFGEWV